MSEGGKTILVMHGPNLNLLGQREPDHYGNRTLKSINRELQERALQLGVALSTFQSNHEGALVDRLQQACGTVDGLIINPAAFTHTSIAIRDAILVLEIPTIEIHLSNIHQREAFRRHSYIADIATGQITGLGPTGYLLALEAMARLIT